MLQAVTIFNPQGDPHKEGIKVLIKLANESVEIDCVVQLYKYLV